MALGFPRILRRYVMENRNEYVVEGPDQKVIYVKGPGNACGMDMSIGLSLSAVYNAATKHLLLTCKNTVYGSSAWESPARVARIDENFVVPVDWSFDGRGNDGDPRKLRLNMV